VWHGSNCLEGAQEIEEIYTHAQDEAKRKALEKFEARLVQ